MSSKFGKIEFVNKTAEEVLIVMLAGEQKFELPTLGPGESTVQVSPTNVEWIVVHDDYATDPVQAHPNDHVVYNIAQTIRLEQGPASLRRGGD